MVIPALVIAIYTLVLDGIFSHRRKQTGASWSHIYRLKDRLWELNCGILGLFLSEGAAFVITGSLKNLCGKPRPDLIARCIPIVGSVDPPVFGLSNSTICTQTDKAIMADGFRSFPSGHSSSAFAGLFYLSLYLAAKLHVLDNRGEVWRTFIVLIPTLVASCIAMSRIMDARHHPFDVLFGSALGILVAWASYRQYFPPVSETWRKGRAYPIRTWGMETKQPPVPGGNEMIRTDSDMEPYRTRAAAATSSSSHVSGAEVDLSQRQSGANVFREQISRSQRQRTGEMGSENPYLTTVDGTRYITPRQRDDDWSATTESSEDELDGRTGTRRMTTGGNDAFEMQKTSYPSGDPEVGSGIRHAPPTARLGDAEDTEYRGGQSQIQRPRPVSETPSAMHPGNKVMP